MRSEFLKAMQAVPDGEPTWKDYTTIVPSTARIESYAWMTPSPGMAEYVGHRREAMLDATKYNVANIEYDDSIIVRNRDIEDDQIGGYQLRMKEMPEKARIFPAIVVIRDTLALGNTLPCFDGTNFFATTHNMGGYPAAAPAGLTGGGNLYAYTSANSADGLTYQIDFLIHPAGSGLKPLLWQDRKPLKLGTNQGSPESLKDKKSVWWCDMEGAGAFGYWWQAVKVVITNTPNLQDMFNIFDAFLKIARKFTLPAALSTDPVLYTYQGMQFNAANTSILCSTGLEALLQHALGEERFGVSVAGSTSGFVGNNLYYKRFSVESSGYLDYQ